MAHGSAGPVRAEIRESPDGDAVDPNLRIGREARSPPTDRWSPWGRPRGLPYRVWGKAILTDSPAHQQGR